MMINFLLFLQKAVDYGLNIYLWIHLIAFLLSWFQPDPNRTFVKIIHGLTFPVWHFISERFSVRQSIAPYVSLLLIIFLQVFLVGSIQKITIALGMHQSASFVLKQIGFLFVIASITVIQTILQLFLFLSVIYFIALLITSNFSNQFIRVLDGIFYPFVKPFYTFLKTEQSKQFAPLLVAIIIYLLMKGFEYLHLYLILASR